ncbi:MAG: ribosome-associated translation inhibitor RaiA [Thermoanaerobaculales bacterium]|nr:ribosome-associated translation inhibitor RaiA [Thermoanaerobaculales bacterium]
MKVEYVARKVTLTDSVKQVAEKKLAKVEKYFADIIDLRVEISQERHLFVADIFLKGKDFDVKSTSSHKDLTTAIQDAVDKLEMQARRAKTRLKGRKRHGGESKDALFWNLEVLEPESAASGTPHIVETTTIPVKPMTIEEAVLQLEKSEELFFVFRNAGTNRVNVLYRRRDNNLALITPDM